MICSTLREKPEPTAEWFVQFLKNHPELKESSAIGHLYALVGSEDYGKAIELLDQLNATKSQQESLKIAIVVAYCLSKLDFNLEEVESFATSLDLDSINIKYATYKALVAYYANQPVLDDETIKDILGKHEWIYSRVPVVDPDILKRDFIYSVLLRHFTGSKPDDWSNIINGIAESYGFDPAQTILLKRRLMVDYLAQLPGFNQIDVRKELSELDPFHVFSDLIEVIIQRSIDGRMPLLEAIEHIGVLNLDTDYVYYLTGDGATKRIPAKLNSSLKDILFGYLAKNPHINYIDLPHHIAFYFQEVAPENYQSILLNYQLSLVGDPTAMRDWLIEWAESKNKE